MRHIVCYWIVWYISEPPEDAVFEPIRKCPQCKVDDMVLRKTKENWYEDILFSLCCCYNNPLNTGCKFLIDIVILVCWHVLDKFMCKQILLVHANIWNVKYSESCCFFSFQLKVIFNTWPLNFIIIIPVHYLFTARRCTVSIYGKVLNKVELFQ